MKANKGDYLHVYKADITDKDREFARLQQLKLVQAIVIYSDSPSHAPIDELFKDRSWWASDNELKYLPYKFFKSENITSMKSIVMDRKSSFWTIEITEPFSKEEYICWTTLNYLKYISKKCGPKAWVFSSHSKLGINPTQKYYKLTDARQYSNLIKKGKIVVLDPFLARQCERLRNKLGHSVEYMADEYFIPRYTTKTTKTRKKIITEYGLSKHRLVCLTDGKTVSRIEKCKADELIKQFPTMHFCNKAKYHNYLNELEFGSIPAPGLTKQHEDGIRRLRRLPLQKKRMYRQYKSQFIETWVPDETGGYEELISTRRIQHKLQPTVDTPKTIHNYATERKKRLMRKYKYVFIGEERRNDHFSAREKWSMQFMDLLAMVNTHKPERQIALKISEIFPGWNDKTIKRFIQYLRLTRHGLNYEPNKKTKPIQRHEKVERNIKGITISKFPYNQPITVEYKSKQKDGTEKISIEQNVVMRNKQIIKDVPNQKLSITICPVKDVIKWVSQDKYSDKEGAKIPWVNLVTITDFKRTKVVKVPFHLPLKTKTTKHWRHPISPKPINRANPV
jgi:hypothetical protein